MPRILRRARRNNCFRLQRGVAIDMISELPNPIDNDPSNRPPTARYTAISQNIVMDGLSKVAKTCVQVGERHRICCSCGPGVDCATNPDCECRMVSEQVAKYFNSEGEEKTFYNTMLFVCGAECRCNHTCSMRLLDEADEHHLEKFEARRRDEAKGFGVFAKKDIPAGSIIATFNGELAGRAAVKRQKNAADYALLLIHHQEVELREFYRNTTFADKQYKSSLLATCRSQMFINPLTYGNCARFLSHSCKPNATFWRAIQGGISPADMRIYFVAKEAIKAGEEISFDYGEDYEKTKLKHCLCEPCINNRQEKKEAENKLEEQRENARLQRKRSAELEVEDENSSQAKKTRGVLANITSFFSSFLRKSD
ncbi:CRE-SET-19 protein [Caenorhabditis remanei]|uniref:CRE-SET-19 protein n=1 Tax=Caenorhabditis remanei TaxID=31234 RepID=E3LDW6_CAERE|nr:CRE-SET-19 protein [Caenorhabditis remanei]